MPKPHALFIAGRLTQSPPCGYIPAPENPAFTDSLIPDAELFAKYVGASTMQELGNQQQPRILKSALHVEMKLLQL